MTTLALLLNADRPYVVRRLHGRWACIPTRLPFLTTWHDDWAAAFAAAESYAAAARRMHANRETS